jgi:putative FmdB family regulatory protein
MPIYEYQCNACGHQLDAFQDMKDKPLKECPVCHKDTLSKLISAAGFQLKGSGWYATDYSKKGASETKSQDKSSKTETEKESPSKSENSQPNKEGTQTNSSKSDDTKSDKTGSST